MTTALWIEFLICVFIIVSISWGWKAMKGTAGSHGLWIAALVLILLAMIFGPSVYRSINSSMTGTGDQWVFSWNLPPGQYDRGLNSDTLEVRIERNDSESLWFDTPYTLNGSTELGHYFLHKSGDQFSGSWSQNQPKDGGSIYLRKVGEYMWVGQCTDRSDRSFSCVLKRK
jgi:hypothetical protein